ncbi:MAG: TrkH family potassium uptake protein [ANME-2 cluster archaeon]|nr:TrkH family potassium uptake protein [ANME-2 cluster archaeon]
MKFNNLKIIAREIGNLLLIVCVLSFLSISISFIFNEYHAAFGLLVTSLLSGIAGLALKYSCKGASDLQLKHAMAISSIAWLVIPLFSALPYILVERMSPLNSFFEAVSGWTGTGLSMIVAPSQLTHTIQFWRSLTQWIGGVGVIVLMLSIITRPGTIMFYLYRAEGREEKIFPHIMDTVRMIWWIYFFLTFISILLLLAVGMPLWDSINHAMVAVGTGGFSIKDASIASYDNPFIELALIPIMVIGAVSFLVHYKILKGNPGEFLRDLQCRTLLIVIIVAAFGLTLENYLHFSDWILSSRYSIFQVVSALTCTGLQTGIIHEWTSTAHIVLILVMLLGGAAGSTAGGIKLIRGVALYSGIDWWFKKISLPENAVVVHKFGEKVLSSDNMYALLSEAALISFLWFIFLIIGIFVMLQITPLSYDLDDVIFEVVSAQSNVGLSTGITTPDMNWAGKIMLIINMWIGRLEIIPIIVMFKLIFRGFE